MSPSTTHHAAMNGLRRAGDRLRRARHLAAKARSDSIATQLHQLPNRAHAHGLECGGRRRRDAQ